jgi:hypothetical protein
VPNGDFFEKFGAHKAHSVLDFGLAGDVRFRILIAMPSGPNRQSARSCPDAPQPADSVTRRLVYTLALLPIVPAVSIIGVSQLDETVGFGPFDGIWWFHLSFSVLWVVATIVIWRRFILWTLGRKWLTVLISAIPFIQVVYAKPLWDAGCIDEDVLRVGQHELGVAVWVWVAVWIWWGWEKLNMSGDTTKASPRPIPVTPTARRVVASVATIPFMVGVFLILGIALEDLFGLTGPPTVAFALAAIMEITLWILIWRRIVVWSRVVVRRTAVAALLCLIVPVVLQFLFWEWSGDVLEVVLGCLPVIGWGVWMVSTLAFWPAAAVGTGEPVLMPKCLKCGYLLIGLRGTRCPECGDEPTIDELWRGSVAAV